MEERKEETHEKEGASLDELEGVPEDEDDTDSNHQTP